MENFDWFASLSKEEQKDYVKDMESEVFIDEYKNNFH